MSDEYLSWEDVKARKAQTDRERVFNQQAHAARVDILHVDLGFKLTKLALRVLQALRLYPKA